MVDATNSNDVVPFCQQMYSLQLLSEAANPASTLSRTRIAGYLYPLSRTSSDADTRYFRVGDLSCTDTVESFHELMLAQSGRNTNLDVRGQINGLITLPAQVLDLIARDIEFEISSGNAPRNRRRVIVTITDGNNDGDQTELEQAVQKVMNSGSSVTMIAAGIATAINTDDIDTFRDQVKVLAGGVERNTVITEGPVVDAGVRLGLDLVEVMKRNGAICADSG